MKLCYQCLGLSWPFLTLLCRVKTPWIMMTITQMTRFPQWLGDHCPVAGRGREPSPLKTEKRVWWQSPVFLTDALYIFTFCFLIFQWLVFVFSDWSPSFCLDLAFKTPIRPILRHEHILSEMDPTTPRNTTARNIYSPIVRFLTPSKESEYSFCHCSSVIYELLGFKETQPRSHQLPLQIFWLILCFRRV